MASEFCLSITKYFLFLFNLIFFFLGFALLSLGLWIQFSETSFLLPDPHYISLTLVSYILIIVGSVTVLLSFFGSLGALKGVKCMLGIYVVLLILLLTSQIVGVVLLFTQWSAFKSSIDSNGLKLIQSFEKNNSTLKEFETTFHAIQHKAKCCGWQGQHDWTSVEIHCSCWYPVNATDYVTDYSYSTCPCGQHPAPNSTCAIYNQGCGDIIIKWLDEHFLIIICVVLAIAVVEICGTILSMSLYRRGSVDYFITRNR